ncbi:MAG: ATP-binding cassette domain-containing protein [Verrucomicrobia bacterium]|nr:ATP-binding cassette domain-containing protein [Verrucomicrobiota bacterium]
MLTVTQLSKAYAGRQLFKDASLQVNRDDRIGLIGANGAGKTTLVSILLGNEQPDSGQIALQKGVRIGYLPQESSPSRSESILELVTLYPSETESLGTADVWDRHIVEARAKRILRGLSFRETDFNKPADFFSGGWIMRAQLARLLVFEPDLLLLDEPTNHLDLESLIWFQNYLKSYSGAILMISHDRSFLNNLAENIIEIDHARLVRYRGNFDQFLAQKAARQEQLIAAYKNQQSEIARLQTFIDRFGAKNTKASQAQSKRKQIERMGRIEIPEKKGTGVSFRFPQPVRSGQKLVELRDVMYAYGDKQVYERLNYTVERGQRTVLVGPNGAGKSTLLKLLAGVLPVQQGVRELGSNIHLGYYSQHRVDMLNLSNSVIEEANESGMPQQTVRATLGAFLFRGDDVFKSVRVLSGGEKSRLALAKLLLDPPNFLLMDEPTTHLDIESINALIAALQQYTGTIVFISHDVHLIRTLASSVLHVRAGKVKFYPGDYQYYLDKTMVSERVGLTATSDQFYSPENRAVGAHKIDNAPAAGSSLAPNSDKLRKRREAEERNLRTQERRVLEAKMKNLEDNIMSLEARQRELVTELENSATELERSSARSILEINKELRQINEQLQHLSPEWERLVDRIQK